MVSPHGFARLSVVHDTDVASINVPVFITFADYGSSRGGSIEKFLT